MSGQIMTAITEAGFTINALQMFRLEKADAEEFYEIYKGVVNEYSVSSVPFIVYTFRVSAQLHVKQTRAIHTYISFRRVFESSFMSVYILHRWERKKDLWSVLSQFSLRKLVECLNFKYLGKQDVQIIWPQFDLKLGSFDFDHVCSLSSKVLVSCDLTKQFFARPKSLFPVPCGYTKDYLMIQGRYSGWLTLCSQ